jgi:putative protein-disulfide isomerase
MPDSELIYVFDPYCGWSYGFEETMSKVHEEHPELPARVVCGGLFTGDRVVPMREHGFLGQANARIRDLTGATFGDRYQDLVDDGRFVMDSEAAAVGFAALREAAPDRQVPLAAALQKAFFIDGLSLSDEATYAKIAEDFGLDADAVVTSLYVEATARAARADSRESRDLGVTGFPTLILRRGDQYVVLAQGIATVDQVEQRLARVVAAANTGRD